MGLRQPTPDVQAPGPVSGRICEPLYVIDPCSAPFVLGRDLSRTRTHRHRTTTMIFTIINRVRERGSDETVTCCTEICSARSGVQIVPVRSSVRYSWRCPQSVSSHRGFPVSVPCAEWHVSLSVPGWKLVPKA